MTSTIPSDSDAPPRGGSVGRRTVRPLVAGLTLAALALAGCSTKTEPQKAATPKLEGEPIVFGIDEDSTGPGASYSPIAGRAIRDAVDKVNETGGILGRPVKVTVENDESDPTKAPTVIRKLSDGGSHVIFGLTSTAAMNQAKPVVEQAKKPLIASVATTGTLADPPNNSYLYSVANATSDWAKVYCGAFAKQGWKKIALMADSSTTIDAVNKQLLQGMNGCVEVVAHEKAPLDSADVSAQAARIRDAKPDAVLVTSVGGNAELLFHNTLFRTMKDTPRFSLAALGNQPASWKLADPGALKGMVFMGSLDSTKPATVALTDELRRRRGDDKYALTAFDAQGWDSVMLVKKAIEQAGGTDGEKVKQALDGLQKQQASFGQPQLTLSWGPQKRLAVDGLCGLVLTEFGSNNKPEGPWKAYQPPCS